MMSLILFLAMTATTITESIAMTAATLVESITAVPVISDDVPMSDLVGPARIDLHAQINTGLDRLKVFANATLAKLVELQAQHEEITNQASIDDQIDEISEPCL